MEQNDSANKQVDEDKINEKSNGKDGTFLRLVHEKNDFWARAHFA